MSPRPPRPGDRIRMTGLMPEDPHPLPDALFDADLSQPLGSGEVILDGQPVHAPVVYTWSCPECGESGHIAFEDLIASNSPHGSQHAQGVWGRIVPLNIDTYRKLPDGGTIPF